MPPLRESCRAAILLILLLSPPTAAAQTAATDEAQRAEKIDEYLGAAERAEHFSGAVLVAEGGRPVLSKGYGMASYELGVPNTPRTVFQIASLTKAFTATAIMQLQEKGRLSDRDSICDYIDSCPPAWRAITLRHLLTHTAGIPNYTSFPEYLKTAAMFASDEEIVARFRNLPLEFAPGERYSYSNSGYHLLGLIIEKVSGAPYGSYLQSSIFTPLGMTSSGRVTNQAIIRNRAAGYAVEDGARVNAALQDLAHLGAEGGVYSTTEDLLAWTRSLSAPSILTRASLDEMLTPFRGTYGYGWNISELHGRRHFSHAGRNFGFSSFLRHFPTEDLSIIILSNNQMVDAEKIAADLAAILFGVPYRIPREPRTVALSILAAYVGIYQLAPGNTITVSLEGGRLFAQGTGQGKSELFASSHSQFFLRSGSAEIRFESAANGAVTAMTLLNAGREIRAERRVADGS